MGFHFVYQIIFEQQTYILLLANKLHNICCFRYHKGTDFQVHSIYLEIIFSCFRYHKGTDFQANHNYS